MLAPQAGYHRPDPPLKSSRAERRGTSRRSVIEAAKEAVSTLDLAERLCGTGALRRSADRFVARCPLPDHDDKTPSFTVYPETDSFFCYGCLRGGDVVELALFAWGYARHEVAMAAADLLHEFGHEIPPRPASWFRKQERQRPVRDAIDSARFEHLRRRLFRRFFLPSLVVIADTEERKAEAAAFWEATEPLARMMIARLAEARS